MSTTYIHQAAGQLIQKCHSRDPFVIAEQIGEYGAVDWTVASLRLDTCGA